MKRSVAVVCGVGLGIALVAGAVAGTAVAQTTDAETNASLGGDVSAFMQASEAEAEHELEGGMFDAGLNRSNDPDAQRELLERHHQRLEERAEALQTRRQGIDEASGVRSRAIATRVAVGASGLERSVNDTRAVTGEVGADIDRLRRIRSSARELRGPDIAELARGLAGPPEGVPGGPPDDDSESDGSPAEGTPPETPPADRPNGNESSASAPSGPAGERSGGDSEGTPNGPPSDTPSGPDRDETEG